MNYDELKILNNKKIRINKMYNKFKKQNEIDELKLKEEINDILGQLK